jgi:hypothetical protein
MVSKDFGKWLNFKKFRLKHFKITNCLDLDNQNRKCLDIKNVLV